MFLASHAVTELVTVKSERRKTLGPIIRLSHEPVAQPQISKLGCSLVLSPARYILQYQRASYGRKQVLKLNIF